MSTLGALPWVFDDGDDVPAPQWQYQPPAAYARPQARDFGFDHITGRFLQAGRDLVLTSGLSGLRQAVEVELRTMTGEWYLDEGAGLPLLSNVLVKSPNLRAIRQIVRDRILSVHGVLEVTRLDLTFDARARALSIAFAARGSDGAFSSSLSLR